MMLLSEINNVHLLNTDNSSQNDYPSVCTIQADENL